MPHKSYGLLSAARPEHCVCSYFTQCFSFQMRTTNAAHRYASGSLGRYLTVNENQFVCIIPILLLQFPQSCNQAEPIATA